MLFNARETTNSIIFILLPSTFERTTLNPISGFTRSVQVSSQYKAANLKGSWETYLNGCSDIQRTLQQAVPLHVGIISGRKANIIVRIIEAVKID